MGDTGEIATVLERLETAPVRFALLLAGLEDADALVTATAPDEWTPIEVLAHVRAANDLWEPRLINILTRDNPPLLAFSSDRWLELSRYTSLPVTDSLESLRLRRIEIVRALRALPPEAWEREGNHEKHGRMTLYDVARYIADHDDEHLAQIGLARTPESGH